MKTILNIKVEVFLNNDTNTMTIQNNAPFIGYKWITNPYERFISDNLRAKLPFFPLYIQ